MTIEWLRERMAQWLDDPAMIWRDVPFTYRDILDRVDRWQAELRRQGVEPGQVVLLEGDFSPNACALLLALIDLKTVVVPLTRLFRAHLEEFERIAETQVHIRFDEADQWSFARRAGPVTNKLTLTLIARGRPGLVIFSSGSTGKHKAVLHDFSALLEKFKTPRRRKSTIAFLLFDHIGGMDTLFTALANGGTLVTLANRNPDEICRAIAAHKVHTLPTSPTFLNMLLISRAYHDHDLSSLQLIAYGSEPMPESMLACLREALPHVRFTQTFGMSELGVLRTQVKDSDSLWFKLNGNGFETKIVDNTLWVRADSAMLGYLNAPDLFDEEGWLNTQDVVEMDGEYIRIMGRASEIINVGGQKVYPAEVENVLRQLENVGDVVVYGEKSPITGHIVAARFNLVEPEDLITFKRRMRAFCKDRLATYTIPIRVEITNNDQVGARFKKIRRRVEPAEPVTDELGART